MDCIKTSVGVGDDPLNMCSAILEGPIIDSIQTGSLVEMTGTAGVMIHVKDELIVKEEAVTDDSGVEDHPSFCTPEVQEPRSPTDMKPHLCVICGYRFAQAWGLKRHMMTHTGEKPHICDVCHAGFRDGSRLKRHKKRYNGNNPCGRFSMNEKIEKKTPSTILMDPVSDVEHYLYSTMKVEDVHISDECSSSLNPSLSENYELDEPKLVHTEDGEKGYTCDNIFCESVYKTVAILSGHQMTNNGEEPYLCDFCGLKFSQASDLNRHVAYHTCESPARANDGVCDARKSYSCYTCGYICKEKRTLRIHVRMHCNLSENDHRNVTHSMSIQKNFSTDGKRYSCVFCGFRFTRPSSLKRHVMTHTGEKPHSCDVCHAGFRDACQLKRHKLRYNGRNPCARSSVNGAFKKETPSNIHMDNQISEVGNYSCYPSDFEAEESPTAHIIVHTVKVEDVHGPDSCDSPSSSANVNVVTSFEDAQKSYSCYTCGYTCATKQIMSAHVRVHKGISGTENWNMEESRTAKRLYASELGNRFARACDLKRHVMTHTGEKPHSCEVCDVGFRDASRLKSHKMKCSGENPCAGSSLSRTFKNETPGNNPTDYQSDAGIYSCYAFDHKCKSEESLVIHMREHNVKVEDTRKSDPCNSNFDGPTFTEGDTLSVTKAIVEKSYACDVCKSVFKNVAKLRRHMRSHTCEKPYTCDFCEVKFIKASELRRHVRTHTGEKPYVCDICESGFREACKLKRHKLTHTGERPYHCEICGSGFRDPEKLKSHMMIHTGEKPYPCTVCNSNFRTAGLLKQHMMRHTGERPHACEMCGARFANVSNLTTHRRIHTGEKPYACGLCESSFTDSGKLKRHMMRHTGEKPHACEICEARFANASNLTAHRRIHTGEKPYACDFCESSFTDSGKLNRHMMRHTGEKPYFCGICDSRFCQPSALRIHMKVHS